MKKEYPFSITEYYSPSLNSLKRIYTQHPKFNGNVRLVYEVLLDYWNAEYGYAFPDQWELALITGMSKSSIKNYLRVLQELELIEVGKSNIGNKLNNVYYIKQPINNLDEFFKKFPEAKENYEKRVKALEAEKENDFKRLSGKEILENKPEIKVGDKFEAIVTRNESREKVDQDKEIDELTSWL